MRFVHIADCHVGGWRDDKLRSVSNDSFCYAVNFCISEKVDFLLISGDLFNTSLPSMDCVNMVVKKLKELKDNDVAIYFISGSHDFSPSGKSILEILESAGLGVNVSKGEVINNKLRLKFVVDKKTNAKITGLLGRRGGLDKSFYQDLDFVFLEKESGFKIFMFHAAIAELKPKDLDKLDAMSLSLLPKNFDYYAGGHVHIVENVSLDGYKNVVYPGPVFPNSFSELEKLKCGSFVFYNNGLVEHKKIDLFPVSCFVFDCSNKSSAQVNSFVLDELKKNSFVNSIVLLRFEGKLSDGKISDIDFKAFFSLLYSAGAYFVMKSSSQLFSNEFEEVKLQKQSVDDIEDSLIAEHVSKFKLVDVDYDKTLSKQLLKSFVLEKLEGERIADFEKRVKDEIDSVLGNLDV